MKLLIVGLAPVVALVWGCDGTDARTSAIASDAMGSVSTCVANALPRLHLLPDGVPRCAPHSDGCRDACVAGDGASCLASAYDAQNEAETQTEATRLFRQACLLGVANACTNFAATIWAGEHTDDELACARRILGAACEADEHFACGMLGRLAFSQATLPAERARAGRDLEASCQKLKGFPCRVLAKHLEAGDLGPYEPGRIAVLLARACEGGDPDACGEPGSASETFE